MSYSQAIILFCSLFSTCYCCKILNLVCPVYNQGLPGVDGREGIPGMPGGKVSCVVIKTINMNITFNILEEDIIAMVIYCHIFGCREVWERLEFLAKLDFRDFL